MKLLKTLFNKKKNSIKTPEDFWRWFSVEERSFYAVVKSDTNIEKLFFDELSPKLDELRNGFFFLTGMSNNDTVELIITADGNIKNIPFVEDLISAAPKLEGWVFTALKPALNIEDVNITMSGYDFNRSNISFYSIDDKNYPDEIDLRVIYDGYDDIHKDGITTGVYIFLDNLLGELNFVTTIDNLIVEGRSNIEKELIPIDKLKSFLIWREKEFTEKYESVSYISDNDTYSSFDSTTEEGLPIVSIVNTSLLKWENKTSHQWMLKIDIRYDGAVTNGMPDNITYNLLDEIEDELMLGFDYGVLNIGRETGDSARTIFIACRDFRKVCKVTESVIQKHAGKIQIAYDIYKDKYWKTLNRYMIL